MSAVTSVLSGFHWRLGRATNRRAPGADDVVDGFLLPWAGRPSAGTGTLPAYITPQGRDLRVDLLRGFFVFAMIVDHVRGASLLHLLYLVTVALTLTLLPLSEVFGLPWAQGVDLSQPVSFVVSVLTLHRTYYLADVMLLYTLLFLLLPLALLLLAGGKTKLLLGASWLLWGLYQFFPAEAAAT